MIIEWKPHISRQEQYRYIAESINYEHKLTVRVLPILTCEADIKSFSFTAKEKTYSITADSVDFSLVASEK